METTAATFKVDTKVKEEAEKVADKMGLDLDSIVNAYLHELVRSRTVSFCADENEEPSEYLIQTLKESEEDVKAGRVSPAFDNVEEAVRWLDDPNRKYVSEV